MDARLRADNVLRGVGERSEEGFALNGLQKMGRVKSESGERVAGRRGESEFGIYWEGYVWR